MMQMFVMVVFELWWSYNVMIDEYIKDKDAKMSWQYKCTDCHKTMTHVSWQYKYD